MIDTHCHIHFTGYDADRDEVIRRGFDAGVRMITVGTSRKTSEDAVALATHTDGMWSSVGLHPTHLFSTYHDEHESAAAMGIEGFEPDEYRRLASRPKVVAIGECGLEYFRLPEASADEIKQLQRTTFLRHAALATELNLPLIIHCRDAHEDMIQMLTDELGGGRLRRRGVIHSFTGTAAIAAAYIRLGFYIGVNGIVTFAKPKPDIEFLPDVIRTIPLDRMLLETDAPYLAPAPHRGKRNEPAYVRDVAAYLASLMACTIKEIDRITTHNAETLFTLTEP